MTRKRVIYWALYTTNCGIYCRLVELLDACKCKTGPKFIFLGLGAAGEAANTTSVTAEGRRVLRFSGMVGTMLLLATIIQASNWIMHRRHIMPADDFIYFDATSHCTTHIILNSVSYTVCSMSDLLGLSWASVNDWLSGCKSLNVVYAIYFVRVAYN